MIGKDHSRTDLGAKIASLIRSHDYAATPLTDLNEWFDKWAPHASYSEMAGALKAVSDKLESEDA